MSVLSEYGLKVGDKIKVGKNAGPFFNKGDILTISEDDGDTIPCCKNQEGFLEYFDLETRDWTKVAPAKLKRDSVVTLELTGEELFWIKALVGKTTGNYAEDLYNKVSEYIEGYVLRYVLRTINLHDHEDKIEAELNRIFPPEESVKEDPKEMTLEEICQELGYDVKVVKNK